jgi:hypothetical protein
MKVSCATFGHAWVRTDDTHRSCEHCHRRQERKSLGTPWVDVRRPDRGNRSRSVQERAEQQPTLL